VNAVKDTSKLRDRIAEVARELYLAEGLAGLSMRRVAERAGISAPAIYRHFRNKDELLSEIVAQGLRILESYLEPALRAASPYERLIGMTDGYLRFALEQPKYFDFAFLTPSPSSGRFSEEIARPDRATFRAAVEQVAACIEQGVFAGDDPLETAITVWAEVHGLVTLHRTGRLGPDAGAFEKIYRQAVRRLLEALRDKGSLARGRVIRPRS
jgi:AcrR family transcriptional regulator